MEGSTPTGSSWDSLRAAADQGLLFLAPGTAARCNEICNDFLFKLKNHQATARDLAGVEGWGEFSAGRDLRRIYSEKAVGGDNNMVDVLESHITVVREMQAIFQKFFVATTDQEVANAQAIEQVESEE